jgi:phage FluMu protein Com
MQVRCYRCNASYSIGRDELQFALEALEESNGKHYDSRCPRCRQTNKISIEQLRHAVPRLRTEEGTVEQPDDTEHEEESNQENDTVE